MTTNNRQSLPVHAARSQEEFIGMELDNGYSRRMISELRYELARSQIPQLIAFNMQLYAVHVKVKI